jgi:hypothetical protein
MESVKSKTAHVEDKESVIRREKLRRKTKSRSSKNHCCIFCGGGNYPYDELQIVSCSSGQDTWWGHDQCYDAFLAELEAKELLSTAIKSLKRVLRRLRQQSAYRKGLGKTNPPYVPLHKNHS